MGAANFPVPDDLDKVIELLAARKEYFSLVERDGTFSILTGDQVAFIANTQQEAHAFLCGVFLMCIDGLPLEQIFNQ
jgi:hypothetical protein